MNKRNLIGGFSNINYEKLISLMNSMEIINKVNDRYAIDVQKEINYEDENISIYIYDDLEHGFLSKEPTFIFDIELKGSFDEAQAFVNVLTQKLAKQNCPHQFEWNKVDKMIIK